MIKSPTDSIREAVSLVSIGEEFIIGDLLEYVSDDNTTDSDLVALRAAANKYLGKTRKESFTRAGMKDRETLWRKDSEPAVAYTWHRPGTAKPSPAKQKVNASKVTPQQIGEGMIALVDDLKQHIGELQDDIHHLVEEKKQLEETIRRLRDTKLQESNRTLNLEKHISKGGDRKAG